ncbi:MAG TPA: hypothetical protein VH008_22415 [Pseudonocardia sp.]|nr:hypothetical protein [Pseudonocardia sp.]
MNEVSWSRRERTWVGLFAAAALSAVLLPARQNWRAPEKQADGFPFSYYPMFSKRRRQHANVVYAVGITADGTRRRLRHSVLGTGGLNQVRRQIYRVALTEERADDYATALLPRLLANPSCDDLVSVEIVRGVFDLDECLLSHEVVATEEHVLAAADLGRVPATASELTPAAELVTAEELIPTSAAATPTTPPAAAPGLAGAPQ